MGRPPTGGLGNKEWKEGARKLGESLEEKELQSLTFPLWFFSSISLRLDFLDFELNVY